MNRDTAAGSSFFAYTIALLGAFLIMFILVRAMKQYTAPPPVNVKRAEERRTASRELQAASAKTLSEYAVLDKEKGIYQLPVERAMELVVQEWQDPGAARSNLISRVEKATALPPKEPEPPSPFE